MYKTLKKPVIFVVLFCFIAYPQMAYSLPQGANVVAGAADPIPTNPTGTTLTITQHSLRLITEWLSFSIGELETVTFNQLAGASSIALNRVTGGNPSAILGTLSANGRVFLINPNGILFGVNSVVDTAGLVASTLSLGISDIDFMNPSVNAFPFVGPGGPVVNYGTLRTLSQPGGYVALLGSSVKNYGLIQANLGTVVLAGGEEITLNLDPNGVISAVVKIDKETNRNDDGEYAAVNNAGRIVANGGRVILTADILDTVFKSAVNNDGIIEAGTIEEKNGQVLLKSNQNIELNGVILATGAIDAHAAQDIILGRDIGDILLSFFSWEYLSGSRGYRFVEFGYYYGDGTVRIPLSIGFDIGKDGSSPTTGAGNIGLPGEPTGLYAIFVDHSGKLLTYFQDSTLNPDSPVGLEHLDLNKLALTGTEYWWEDMLNNGDQDFDDAVIDFVKGLERIRPPDALLNSPNIFLTAQNGSITQLSGDIYADNLMLSSNTGVSGTGSNGGISTHANNISAVNRGSGDIRVSNKGTLTIANLSSVQGLNAGVTGYDGIANNAVGGQVNIEVKTGSLADLNVMAPVNSFGPVFFSAVDSIRHGLRGIVRIFNPYLSPGAPTGLMSPSHTVGAYSDDRTVDVVWGLPDSTPGYGFWANAGGSYEMTPGSAIQTQGGNVSMTANGDITLSSVDAQSGNVNITSQSGSISDADLDSVPAVIAHNIQMSAPGGIGPIGIGHPYDFSHLWDNLSTTSADSSIEPYSETFNPSTGDWSFATTSSTLADGDWWFHVATVDRVPKETALSPTAHIGPFRFGSDIPPPPPEDTYWEAIEKDFRVYYEILDPSQFLSFEPATTIGLYAYHPLTPADLSAFDDIELDSGAYDFIDGNIKMKKRANKYFGI